MARGRTVRTLKKEAQFLKVLRETANVSRAAKTIGITRQTAHDWRKQDENFALAWDDALDEAMESAEGEVYRRAVKGTLKPVFYQGAKCGQIREYSDSLLMFMLKGHSPQKYKDRTQTELTGSGGQPFAVNVIIDGPSTASSPGDSDQKPSE